MAVVAYNQPDPDYRRELGENQSYLKNILISPAHYRAAKKRRFPVTVNMEIGSALHCKVLEGEDEFQKRYILKPEDIAFNTKEGKDWKLQQAGKTILSNSDKERAWDSVHGMAESLFKLDWFNPRVADYRKFNELSIYWEADNVPCKGRLDRLVDAGDQLLVLDLKTTDSVDPHTFQKKVTGGMNYLFQAAWYAEAASLAYDKPAKFIFIAIERAEPWSTAIFEVSNEMMDEGNRQIKRARQLLAECLKTKEWPRPEVRYNVLDLPGWYQSPVSEYRPEFEDLF
jgi:exodeoxyribonuclease VIII